MGYRSEDAASLNEEDPSTPDEKKKKKKSRPSLSDRTIETLSQTPSSRRRSNFFVPESPMGPPSRPASRPASALDGRISAASLNAHAAAATLRPASVSKANTGIRRTSLALNPIPRMAATPAAMPRAQSPTKSSTLKALKTVDRMPSQPSTVKKMAKLPTSGSKTFSGRIGGSTSRPSLTGLFRESNQSNPFVDSTPSKPTKAPIAKRVPSGTKAPAAAASPKSPPNPAKSSAALREQIRKAKAERRSLSAKQNPPLDRHDEFDVSSHADPFNQQPKNLVIKNRVGAARTEGRLNIAALGLKEIPEEVLNMYDYECNKSDDVAWGEVVDLTRIIAADNEIETIPDDVFPDIDAGSLGQDDESKGPQFAGIDFLDLHGNILVDVPIGFRRLQMLTHLNLVRQTLYYK
jgi:hypothetical protein